MKARLILWFMSTNLYRWLMRNVIPKIRFSWSYGKLNGNQFETINRVIKSGDIIAVRDNWKLTGMLVPGWDHIEFFQYGKSLGMHAEGLRVSTLFDVCKECNDILILRCKSVDQTMNALEKSEMLLVRNQKSKISYDLLFSLDVEALACSELAYHLYPKVKWDLSDVIGIGRPYLSPQGVVECEDFEVVYDSRGDV